MKCERCGSEMSRKKDDTFFKKMVEKMGIRFDGHSDLRRLLLPPNWEGHPLRKDYPLGYEEVQYTFNLKEIDLRKPKGVR